MTHSAAIELFVEQLDRLRAAAGNPSQAELVRLDGGTGLKRSSLSELLKGEFTKTPPWERIEAYTAACVAAAATRGIALPLESARQRLRHDHDHLTRFLDRAARNPDTPPAPPPSPKPQRRRFGVVPPRAGAFQPRAVAAVLDAGAGTTVLTGAGTTPASVLVGLGGVGKTQIAADHAHTLWEADRVDLLVWISARSRDAITTAYTDVAVELLSQDRANPDRAWKRLLSWLAETTTSWLVVLDDVQNPADLSGLWPPHSPGGQVVATTRCRDAALHGDRRRLVDVDLFTPAEALTYLTEKLPDRARTDTATTQLAGLAADLGFLPLALAQAAAYLTNKPLLTTADYRAQLADRRTALREVLPSERDLPDEHQQTVAATWSLSIEAADQLDPAGLARPVMELASLLDPAGIPAGVFAAGPLVEYLAARCEREVSVEDVLGGLECLRRFSLLTLDSDQVHRAVRVHALVQRAVRDSISTDTVGDLARADADALLCVWRAVEAGHPGLIQALRSNTSTLQDNAEEHLWEPDGHPVLSHFARDLIETGLLDSALTVTKRLYHQAFTRLGPNHPDTLTVRGNLAYWRGEAGDPAGAATDFEHLLTDYLRVLGPNHPDTLTARVNLARWRGEAGDPAGAATDFEHLLTDYLRVLGPNHPNTLTVRANLAHWRGEAGDPAGAATDFEHLLTDYLRVLSPNHPNTLTTRDNLACWRETAGEAP
jgi:hypothetical protein